MLNKYIHILAYLAIFSLSLSASAVLAKAQEACQDIVVPSDMIDVSFDGATEVSVGETIDVSVKNTLLRQNSVELSWLILAMEPDVRFSGTGFIIRTPGSAGPYGMPTLSDKMRLFVPLHDARLPDTVNIKIRPLKEGNFNLSWFVAQKSRECENEFYQSRPISRDWTVNLSQPIVVLQDLYDYRTPEFNLVSTNGQYEILSFQSHFQVFDRLTGEKILDERGVCPDFSPTGRFVSSLTAPVNFSEFGGSDEDICVFNTSGKSMPMLEVYDLAAQEVVTRVHPPALWAQGDTYLYVPAKWWKELQGPGFLMPLLNDQALSNSSFRCHFSENSAFRFDWSNGILIGEPNDYGLRATEYCDLLMGKDWPDNQTGQAMIGHAIAPSADVATSAAAYLSGSHGHFTPNFDEVYGHVQDYELVKNGFVTSQIVEPKSFYRPGQVDRQPRMLVSALMQQRSGPTSFDVSSTLDRVGQLLDVWLPPPTYLELSSVSKIVADVDELDLSDDEKYAELLERSQHIPAISDNFLRNSKYDEDLQEVLECWPSGSTLRENMEQVWSGRVGRSDLMLIHTQCQSIGTVGGLVENVLDLYLKQAGKVSHFRLIKSGLGSQEFDEEGDTFSTSSMTANNPVFRVPSDSIQFRKFKASIHLGRYLVISVKDSLFVLDFEKNMAIGSVSLNFDATESEFSILEELGVIVQVDRERAAFYSLTSGERILNGRIVDDEVVIYADSGHFVSSSEGASFVHLKFSGRSELYSLDQFRSTLFEPEIVRNLLQGDGATTLGEKHLPPPSVIASFNSQKSELRGNATFDLTLSGYSELDKLEVFVDGVKNKAVHLSNTPMIDGALKLSVEVNFSIQTKWISFRVMDVEGRLSNPEVHSVLTEMFPFAEPKGSKLHLISAGSDNYAFKDAFPPLRYAVEDSKRFLNTFQAAGNRGFEETRIAGEFLNSQQLRNKLMLALEKTAEAAAASDLTVIHLAGHGAKSENGAFYLASYETDPSNLSGTAISWSEIATAVSKISGRVLVLIDACHAGAAQIVTNDDVVNSFLAQDVSAIAVVAASKGRQFSFESEKSEAGIFTKAITDVIGGGVPGVDNNNNDYIELSELYLHLKSEVVAATQGAQTPWIARNDLIGEVPLFATTR